jgi:hypothetical protein
MSDPTVPNPFFNVVDFGAKGDGTTDDTTVINKAIAAAASSSTGKTGNTVFFPAGTYCVTSSLEVPRGVSLEGVGWNTPGAEDNTFAGSWIFVDAGASFSPVTLSSSGAAVRDLGFNVCNQSTAGAPASAEPMILITGHNCLVEDVCLYNPYGGIYIVDGAQNVIRRVFGQPIQYGIKIDASKDTNYIDSIHFWTYWQGSGTPVGDYQLANGTAIGLFRCDNPLISNVFALHYSVGLSLSTGAKGEIPHKVHLVNADFDGCVTGIHIYSPGTSTDFASIEMSNVTIQAPSGSGVPTGNGIWVQAGSDYTMVQAANVQVTGSGGNAIEIGAEHVNFYGSNISIEHWSGSYGFYILSSSSYAWLDIGFAYTSGGTPYYPVAQFRLTGGGVQLQASGASTVTPTGAVLTGGTAKIDTAGGYSPADGLYTVPAPGNYLVMAAVNAFSLAGPFTMPFAIVHNGSTVVNAAFYGTNSREPGASLQAIITCSKGDRIGVAAGGAYGSYQGGSTTVGSFCVVNL